MKYFGSNSPQLKKAGLVIGIGIAVVGGLALLVGIAVVVLLFQLIGNTSISVDVNQLTSQISSFFSGIFSSGQEALENAPVQVQFSPSQ